MADTSKFVDATFYIQIEPVFGRFDRETAVGANVVRMSKGKPSAPIGGTLLTKLTVRVPVAAFKPLLPEAVIVIPESMMSATPIEVIVTDPEVQT